MVYRLGIDVGSAYVSAAVIRDGRTEILPLGGQDARMPAVLFVRSDGEFLAGRAAQRRALAEPARSARDFVRRLGDPTPLLIAGVPYPPQALIAHLLGLVAATAAARFGGPPDGVTVAYPACWSPYKADLLLGALRQADFDGAPDLAVTAAPVAMAAQRAHRTGSSAEDLVAVYDLGAGSFDAAVVGGHGPELLGTATGMEQFGGFDMDEALLAHVLAAAGVPDGTESATGLTDPGRVAWRARLRAECAEAKELLSEDSETEISVDTGGGSAQAVTVTREQFERLIRPALVATVKGLRRALRSVPVEASELHGLLLHGGCARIPLAQLLLAEELGPDVSFDLRPPEEIALGAALLAAGFPALGFDSEGDAVVPMETVVIGAPLATSLPPSDPRMS
ncbi:MAG: Hsp70 family protein, partial [Frankia sp.]